MVATFLAGVMIGMIIGRFFRDPVDDCPKVVLGYNCKGDTCDHRESELRRAQMTMALNREKLEAEQDKNYWSGDN